MKKRFIALAMAAIIPATVFAATDGSGWHDRGPKLERLAERLDLSADQQEKMRVLFEAHKAERQAMREKMRASMADVLTPEQQAKMDTLRAERRANREERHERRQKRAHRRHGKECGSSESATQS